MTVIAFVGNKGGVGKTTLSINFSVGLSSHATVALVDADPQGSALQWHQMSDTENRLAVYDAESRLSQQIKKLQDDYDHVVIDCPPYVQSTQTAAVLQLADIALIPVLPSPIDLWATVHIEKVAEEARKTNPNLDVILVINQLELRTTFSRLMREALAEINFTVAKATIRRRAVYRNSAVEGKSVYDMGKRGAAAAEELNELVKEVTV
ncbi:MAG: AAA family ATPase [Gammaproteobacteria bacterium]|nr:AAA family ATPase [Gammaproteobacteria bacterium]